MYSKFSKDGNGKTVHTPGDVTYFIYDRLFFYQKSSYSNCVSNFNQAGLRRILQIFLSIFYVSRFCTKYKKWQNNKYALLCVSFTQYCFVIFIVAQSGGGKNTRIFKATIEKNPSGNFGISVLVESKEFTYKLWKVQLLFLIQLETQIGWVPVQEPWTRMMLSSQ